MPLMHIYCLEFACKHPHLSASSIQLQGFYGLQMQIKFFFIHNAKHTRKITASADLILVINACGYLDNTVFQIVFQ